MRVSVARLAGLACAVFALAGAAALEGQTVHVVGQGCNNCHNLHGGSGTVLSNFAVAEDLCLNCHAASAGQGAPEGLMVHAGYRHAQATTCVECHTPHRAEAGANLKLIEPVITTPNSGDRTVVFTATSGPNSYADGINDYDGVCEVCHTQTDHHVNSTQTNDPQPKNHNAGATCTSVGCHNHRANTTPPATNGGFEPPACLECHDQSQGGGTVRAVDVEFGYASHHVQGTPGVLDCRTCHEMTEHYPLTPADKRVRLKNVDFPRDETEVIELAGDPFTDSGEALKLNTFCLACHDPAGVGPSQPFTDGFTPPTIDSTVWEASSHSTDSDVRSCFATCHASGHGSRKQKLFAPYTVAPTAPANAEEEEGFCFNCHDGSVAVDVETGFLTSILWSDDGVGGGSQQRASAITTLNDRHDVQYAASSVSGAKIECYDCHDPHAANSSNRPMSLLRADPDPNDGRVPGTGWFATFTWAGGTEGNTSGLSTDARSEWCLDCHDGSLPAGVLNHSSVPTVNLLDTLEGSNWANNAMGAGPSAANLKTDNPTDWALDAVLPCAACHQAHPDNTPQPVTASLRNNLFQLVDTVFGTDGTTRIVGNTEPWEYTDQTSRRNPELHGEYFCYTCHASGMANGPNCVNCHVHNDASRF